MIPQQEVVLRLQNIGKLYAGNRVLSGVSFDVKHGEIVGLVGENGAGKSTLMKILFGMTSITESGGFEGTIEFNGKPVRFTNPFEALDAGIGMVHQEFSLIAGFTATENILLNRESLKNTVLAEIFGPRMKSLDRALMTQRSTKAIERLGVAIDPQVRVKQMPVGHKQFTEIARELDRESVKLLVLDEPTAVLTESEAATLVAALKNLSAKGIACIFISHRLQEVLDLCNKIIVLRDGKLIKEVPAHGSSVAEIAYFMVGRDLESRVQDRNIPRTSTKDTCILSVKNLWVDMPGETVRSVDLSIEQGEIFGIAGLAGQGKLGIPNGIMGLYPAGGEIIVAGKPLKLNDTKSALQARMAFVSEDRRGVGLLLDEGIDWNIAFATMQLQGTCLKPYLWGLLQWRSEKEMQHLAQEYIAMLDIKCSTPKQKAGTLSGGNQQKVCLSKAFALKPLLLFVSEPTRGIDVGAKKLVLEALQKYNREYGTTIVMVSSELEELRSLCGRIAVVDKGSICGILPYNAKIENFGLLMAGITQEPHHSTDSKAGTV